MLAVLWVYDEMAVRDVQIPTSSKLKEAKALWGFLPNRFGTCILHL